MSGNAEELSVKLSDTIKDIGIPPCPHILVRINEEMAKDEPDFRYLDQAISSDVALAAGLIALANSPFFGVRSRVRSVREALQMLGLDVAGRAVAGLILRKLFASAPSLERFWDASAHIARLSGWLAQTLASPCALRTDEAYTFGLFRDCGIPVLLKRYPDYREALKAANAESVRSFIEIEEERCQTNHAAVGCLLAQAWWLPDEISLGIRYHHDGLATPRPDLGVGAVTLRLVACAQLAEHLLQTHTGLSQTCEWDKIGANCLEQLGLDDDALKGLYAESRAVLSAG